jgi:hypothetical protein
MGFRHTGVRGDRIGKRQLFLLVPQQVDSRWLALSDSPDHTQFDAPMSKAQETSAPWRRTASMPLGAQAA